MRTLATAFAFAFALTGCVSTTPTVTREEAFAIYEIKGTGINAADLGQAVTKAVQARMTGVQVDKEIPPAPLPEKPQRFELRDLFKNSGFAAAAGIRLKMPSCQGAMLTVRATNESMARYGENTSFFLCVQPYSEGYWLTVYSTFSKTSGMVSTNILGADLARAFVGDSSQFIPRTVSEVIAAVKATGATVSVLEAYP
jgi:hypothetical protein